MADSPWEACIEAVAGQWERLRADGLLLGLLATSIHQRKPPQVGETIDPLPAICVCPYGAEIYQEFDSEDGVSIGWPVLSAVVSQGNRKLRVAGNKPMPWRELIRKAVRGLGGADVEGLWRIEVLPESVFDTETLAANYDYGAVLFRMWTSESAT